MMVARHGYSIASCVALLINFERNTHFSNMNVGICLIRKPVFKITKFIVDPAGLPTLVNILTLITVSKRECFLFLLFYSV